MSWKIIKLFSILKVIFELFLDTSLRRHPLLAVRNVRNKLKVPPTESS
jgi:hypothetical protein